ncbi:MAG: RNA polymerase sigma-70 factor [bacterium]
MASRESTLFSLIKKENFGAYEELFRLYYPRLVVLAMRYLKRKDLAEEKVQDVFLQIWEKKESLTIKNVPSYLYRATVNECLQYIRHEKIVDEHAKKTGETKMTRSFQPEEIYFSREIEEITRKTLDSLSKINKKIFLLNRNEGLTYREIAEKLNLSVKTIEAHMTVVLKTFRKVLKDFSE